MSVERPLALYNLEDDPGESVDVSPAFPQIVTTLSALAEVARSELGDSLQHKTGTGVRPAATVKRTRK